MPKTTSGKPEKSPLESAREATRKAGMPTAAQSRWLRRGLEQPGGKLPLFDEAGREIPHRTIKACMAAGWAEPWFSNPIKPDWMVCKLTPQGIAAITASGNGKKS